MRQFAMGCITEAGSCSVARILVRSARAWQTSSVNLPKLSEQRIRLAPVELRPLGPAPPVLLSAHLRISAPVML